MTPGFVLCASLSLRLVFSISPSPACRPHQKFGDFSKFVSFFFGRIYTKKRKFPIVLVAQWRTLAQKQNICIRLAQVVGI
jgi:hypothetical protein